MKYKILKEDKDFFVIGENAVKGSREKKYISSISNSQLGLFKYEKYKENCSEACSEKLSYEIAKVLKIPSAKIELAEDKNGNIGIISFLFFRLGKETHTDAKDFFNANSFDRKKFCRISVIEKFLGLFGPDEFEKFLDIMIFDALVGETDRHEENWGILRKKGQYSLSPLYDSSCNLLTYFKNPKISEPYYNKEKNLEEYAMKSKTQIYKEDLSGKYRHFELIEYLYKKYPLIIKKKIMNLKKLNRIRIYIILNRLPNGLISERHKEYIYKYIIIRKKILFDIIKKGELK